MPVSGNIPTDVIESLSLAMKSGNAVQIASYFGTTVELTILDEEDVYSKTQAEVILKNFFKNNSIKDFSILHQGASKEDSKYIIGNLSTSNGNFRCYFLLKNQNGKFTVQQLRIEREKEK
jgi:hypothetical protein